MQGNESDALWISQRGDTMSIDSFTSGLAQLTNRVYADQGLSGTSHLRPAYQAMMMEARAGKFDVLVAEGLDRLSRDQEHIAALHKQLRYLGIPIVTIAEGEISELHIGLKGTMSALFLKDLAQKTHRGLEGRIRDGKPPAASPMDTRSFANLWRTAPSQPASAPSTTTRPLSFVAFSATMQAGSARAPSPPA